MALTLIATAVPSSKYTLLSSAVAVSVTAVSWGNVEHTARFRQVSVFFLGLKGKCCVNLRRWEQKIDELPLGDGIAEWGWCHYALRLSADWDSPEKIRCPLCVPHLVLVWNVWEILLFCCFLTKKFQPSHLLSFLRYFWSSRSSRTKYLQVPMAFSFSRAHKILSVWRVCKIFKSHEHELQPNNSFYGLLVCLCSSVCVSLTLYDRAASRVSLWVIDRHAAVSICFSVTASPPCQKANTYIHWLIWPTFTITLLHKDAFSTLLHWLQTHMR